MTATPSAPFTLLKASSTTPHPASLACFPGENLGHFGRATVAPVASHPSWRHRLLFGALPAGCGVVLGMVAVVVVIVFVVLPSLHVAIISFVAQIITIWRMLFRLVG